MYSLFLPSLNVKIIKTRPTEGVEHPLYDKKVLVFCAMSSKRIYGPYFFESTVNEDRYHKMLVHFFWPKIVREDFRKYYFQQDGASPQRGKKSKNIYNRNLKRNL